MRVLSLLLLTLFVFSAQAREFAAERRYLNPAEFYFRVNPHTGQIALQLKPVRHVSAVEEDNEIVIDETSGLEREPSSESISLRKIPRRIDTVSRVRFYNQKRRSALLAGKKVLICTHCSDPVQVSQFSTQD